MSFVYSPNRALRAVAQKLIDKTAASNPFTRWFPLRETQYAMVQWERKDSTYGLMAGRGYNGKPPKVAGLGSDRKTKVPGVYGESLPIDELELTTRAQPATYGLPVNIDDLIIERTKQGRTRMFNRMILHIVTLLTTGRYVAKDAKGAVIEEDAITPQIYTPTHLWSDLTNSTPWADFQALALLDLGLSVMFNQQSVAVMTQKTFNYYRQNQNQDDIAGRKTKFGATYNNLGDINELHQDDGLPQILIFNDSYLDDSNTAQRYLLDGYVIVMGKRSDDEPLGEFILTRNASNKDFGSQLYYEVIDKQFGQPRSIEVQMGYNGGLAVYQSEAIIVMKVA